MSATTIPSRKRHAERGGRTGRDLPQRSRTRRPVQDHPVAVAGVEHGHDPRLSVHPQSPSVPTDAASSTASRSVRWPRACSWSLLISFTQRILRGFRHGQKVQNCRGSADHYRGRNGAPRTPAALGLAAARRRITAAPARRGRHHRTDPAGPARSRRRAAVDTQPGRRARRRRARPWSTRMTSSPLPATPPLGWDRAPGSPPALTPQPTRVQRRTSARARPPPRRLPAPRQQPPAAWDLTPGHPDPQLISTTDFGGVPGGQPRPRPSLPSRQGPRGHAELRLALAGHLRLPRGIVARPGELIIVPGVASALRTVTARRPACSDAISRSRNPVTTRRGWRSRCPEPGSVPCRSMTTASIRKHCASSDAAVYCTPARNIRSGRGCRCPAVPDLVQWAARTRSLLIEDDYDGEFRYDVSALPALRGIAGGRDCVAYIRTASKMLTPTLRIASAVAARRAAGSCGPHPGGQR